MPLSFPGDSVPTQSGFSLKGIDTATKKRVAVKASNEAISDYGLVIVQKTTSSKYDAGDIEDDGSVTIHTADCQ